MGASGTQRVCLFCSFCWWSLVICVSNVSQSWNMWLAILTIKNKQRHKSFYLTSVRSWIACRACMRNISPTRPLGPYDFVSRKAIFWNILVCTCMYYASTILSRYYVLSTSLENNARSHHHHGAAAGIISSITGQNLIQWRWDYLSHGSPVPSIPKFPVLTIGVISKIRSYYRDCDYRTNSKKQRPPMIQIPTTILPRKLAPDLPSLHWASIMKFRSGCRL